MPCLEDKDSDRSLEAEKGYRTRLQVELDPPLDLLKSDQVEEEDDNAFGNPDLEENSAQENVESQPEDVKNYQLARDRPRREIRKPIRYKDYLSLDVLSYQA